MNASRTFQGGIARALERNRGLTLEDAHRMLDVVLHQGREPLRLAGMPEPEDHNTPLELAPLELADQAQAFVDALGEEAPEGLEAAADLLGALAVLHDANNAFSAAITGNGDLKLARVRLTFAAMALGTLDSFRVLTQKRLFVDAAHRRNDQTLRVEGARQGGVARAAARQAYHTKRNREIADAYRHARRKNSKLTARSWAEANAGKNPWNLSAKRLQAIIRQQPEETCPPA